MSEAIWNLSTMQGLLGRSLASKIRATSVDVTSDVVMAVAVVVVCLPILESHSYLFPVAHQSS